MLWIFLGRGGACRKPYPIGRKIGGAGCVMLTTFANDLRLAASISAGASGYLLKSMPPSSSSRFHQAAAGEMQKMSSTLPLPPGFQMPF